MNGSANVVFELDSKEYEGVPKNLKHPPICVKIYRQSLDIDLTYSLVLILHPEDEKNQYVQEHDENGFYVRVYKLDRY